MAGTKTTRLSLDFPDSVRTKLEIIQERIDAGSMTEVIRRALSLLDHYSEHVKDGGTVWLRKDDGREIELRMF